MSTTKTIEAQPAVVVLPKTYADETAFRNKSGFTNTSEIPSDTVKRFLLESTEQVKKDGFKRVVEELVSHDSYGRYYPRRKYFANAYGPSYQTGMITTRDIQVAEAETASTVTSNLYTRAHMYRVIWDINQGIDQIDPYNNFFTLRAGYPTNNRQVVVSYWYCGKPMNQITAELEQACIQDAIIRTLMWLKDQRLKKGTVSLSLGKQTVTRDENAFNELVEYHRREYWHWLDWFRPFTGKPVRVGRGSPQSNVMRGQMARWM
jgi:hypothetical protein